MSLSTQSVVPKSLCFDECIWIFMYFTSPTHIAGQKVFAHRLICEYYMKAWQMDKIRSRRERPQFGEGMEGVLADVSLLRAH